MAKLMPIILFVQQLVAALNRKDGYIMGATGQNPKKWSKTSWWFTQYTSDSQRAKALYWREHAERVWDCNGLAEGLYKDFSGVDINTKARYNYANWCSVKGTGIIPVAKRVPGAAVFWGNKASDIHHVAYLWKPVKDGHPEGDWYLIEARGVMYGVVSGKLLSRKPNFWGYMDKYFDYSAVLNGEVIETTFTRKLGDRILKNGMDGDDVKEMQTGLIRLGYDLGRWGADGDFGDATELAVRTFQREHGLEVDGEFGPKSLAAYEAALAAYERTTEDPRMVRIEGGDCYVRTAPNTNGAKLGVAKRGTELEYCGQTDENGWHLVVFAGSKGWVSGKYGKLVA